MIVCRHEDPNSKDLCGKPVHPGAQLCAEHEIEKLRQALTDWKRHAQDLKRSLGTAQWTEYYRGVNDGRKGTSYDPEYGRKFYYLEP